VPQIDLTFGIITEDPLNENCQRVIHSILRQQIERSEILIVGGKKRDILEKAKVIPFDESQKKAWITRKKNLITQNALFDHVVYLHDYICLEKGWYEGLLQQKGPWDVMVTKIKLPGGRRYRDHTIFPGFHTFRSENTHLRSLIKPDLFSLIEGMNPMEALIPYGSTPELLKILHPWIYVSGAYWIARKSAMAEVPLDENLCWGEGEDIEWSERMKKKHRITFNEASEAYLLKTKDPIFREISPHSLESITEKFRKGILRQK
jgi:hypothetical protein